LCLGVRHEPGVGQNIAIETGDDVTREIRPILVRLERNTVSLSAKATLLPQS